MLENAIASKPDGLVVSDQYPDVLNDTVKAAVAAGIPVVLTNGGYGEEGHTGCCTRGVRRAAPGHAAELSGIPTGRIVVLAHAISGGLAGLAAVLAVSQVGTAQPWNELQIDHIIPVTEASHLARAITLGVVYEAFDVNGLKT